MLRTLLGVATQLVLLPLLATALFITFIHKRNYLERAGFTKYHVGMILVGSFFGLIADIPVIIFNGALLNINLGGALIPVIIALDLTYKKKSSWVKILLGTGAVAAAAYYFSEFRPDLGIVSEFPQFLIPSIIALTLGYLLHDGSEDQIPYSYITAVLGVLIGADLVRIPLLVNAEVLGSIGGAGAFDLVYLSGLIAALPLVILYYFKKPYTESRDYLEEGLKRVKNGELIEALRYDKMAVKKELDKSKNIFSRASKRGRRTGKITRAKVLKYLGLNPYILEDYRRLMDDEKVEKTVEASKNHITAKYLVKLINSRLNNLFSTLGRRILAYVIDLMIVLLPLILTMFYFLPLYYVGTRVDFTILVALASLSISIQFIYFTLTEWYFGASIGKMALGLRVLSDDFTDISFIQSAARNSVRYADILLFFYIVSIVLILKSPENKRIGDSVADTRVVKIK